jgi:hypothetical protein
MRAPDEADRSIVATRWAQLLGGFPPGQHPLYEALSERASSDRRLIDPVLAAPPEQRRPNLLLAAVHDLVLAEPDGPLAPWYPTAGWLQECRGLEGAPATPPPAPPLPAGGVRAVLDFLHHRQEEIAERLNERATQTNEVGRAGPLAFGLSQLQSKGRPLALLDLGCSAGLNLLIDHFRLELGSQLLGDPAAELGVSTELRGPVAPLLLPAITWRTGIDRQPLSARDEQDARWLLACQWPDQLERFERSRRALRIARKAELGLVRGDLVDQLGEAAARAPAACHLVITCSWAAAYLDPGRQAELRASVHQVLEARPSSWLWLEHPREVPGLVPPLLEGPRLAGSSLLVLEEEPGAPRALAQCQPHGAWLSPCS